MLGSVMDASMILPTLVLSGNMDLKVTMIWI